MLTLNTSELARSAKFTQYGVVFRHKCSLRTPVIAINSSALRPLMVFAFVTRRNRKSLRRSGKLFVNCNRIAPKPHSLKNNMRASVRQVVFATWVHLGRTYQVIFDCVSRVTDVF